MNATKAPAMPRKPAAKPIGAAPTVKAEDLPITKILGKAEDDTKSEASKPAVAKKAVSPPSLVFKPSIPLDAAAAVVEKLIASIKLRGAKMDVDIHSAGCASLNHAALHNDPTLLNRLVLAMPKAARRNALVTWSLKFGNLALNDGANKADFPLVYVKDKPADVTAAIAEPFWALKNVREGGTDWLYTDYMANVMKTLARQAGGSTPEAKKAKAALDALSAVNEALNTANVGAAAPEYVDGMPDRRAITTH